MTEALESMVEDAQPERCTGRQPHSRAVVVGELLPRYAVMILGCSRNTLKEK
jgi:hypothetical protein